MNRPASRLTLAALLLALAGCGDKASTGPASKTSTESVAASGPGPKGGANPPPAPFRPPTLGPGVHEETLQDGARTVRYTVSIPEGYPGEARVPLILALHYGGDVTPFYGKEFLEALVAPALGDLGAIIIAPDSVNGDWGTPENDRAIMMLVDGALASYQVDPRKVLVTGYSMGGVGTWTVASKHPDRFTAAVPVAGNPEGVTGPWRTPVFAVHSRADEIMPIGPTEQRVAELKRAGVNAELLAVDGITHYQTTRFIDPLKKAVPWLKSAWK